MRSQWFDIDKSHKSLKHTTNIQLFSVWIKWSLKWCLKRSLNPIGKSLNEIYWHPLPDTFCVKISLFLNIYSIQLFIRDKNFGGIWWCWKLIIISRAYYVRFWKKIYTFVFKSWLNIALNASAGHFIAIATLQNQSKTFW